MVKFFQSLIWVMFISIANSAFATSKTPSIGPSIEELNALKAKADQLKEAGAVVLSRRGHTELNTEGLEVTTYYNAIYLKSQEAVKDYTRLTSSFSTYYFEKDIDFARVIDGEGKIHTMKEDAISLAAPNSDDYLDDTKQYEFAVPQLKIGNIIEYQTTSRQIRSFVNTEWFSEINFNFVKYLPAKNWLRIDPVIETYNVFDVPNSIKLNLIKHNIDVTPEVTTKDNRTLYVWSYNNVPGLMLESNMPSVSKQLPSVDISTMPNWAQVNHWYKDLFYPSQTSSAEVTNLAQQLFTGLTTDDEKIRAVFQYMQDNIRYIGAHVGRGGYQPHHASEVVTNAYGDCKDQSALIVALLTEANIKAYPVMINTHPGARFNDNLASLNFDHMITYVETEQQTYWLDTSGETGAFPGISGTLAGKKAFVVDRQDGRVLTLPELSPDDNVANISVEFAYQGTELIADVEMRFSGQVETNLRNYTIYSPEKMASMEQLISPFVYSKRLMNYETTDPTDITTPFVITSQFTELFTLTDEITSFNYSYDYSSILKVFTNISALPPVDSRQQAFEVLIPLKVNLSVRYPRPWSDSEIVHRNHAPNMQNAFFEMQHTVTETEDTLQVDTQFILPKQEVSVDDYPEFYQLVQAASDNSSYYAYERQDNSATADISSEPIGAQIDQVKVLLDTAQFESALNKLKIIVGNHGGHAEAHFLLGLAYGFNGQDELSEKAFSRAMELGYEL